MKQNEEEVQYYYDSSADQWWCYDEQQQCWVPWQEEENDEVGGAEPSAAAAGVMDAQTANEAPAAGPDAATSPDAGAFPAVPGIAEEEASGALRNLASSQGTVDSKTQRGKESIIFSDGSTAGSSTTGVKKIAVEDSPTGVTSSASLKEAKTVDAKSADDGERGSTREKKTLTEVDAVVPRLQPGEEEGTDGHRTSNSSSKRSTTGGDVSSGDGKEKQEKLQRDSDKGDKEEKEGEKEDEVSDQAVDRLRSALESLATTPCLDEALLRIGSSSNINRLRTLSITGTGAFPEWLQAGREQTAPGDKVPQLGKDESKKRVSLQLGPSENGLSDQKSTAENEEEEEAAVGELPSLIKHDPIVRRSTRMLTFKDKGGLSGCLREAAKQRNVMIMEAGGYIPGTEQYRQEAWKQRARELASQTHERNQRRWQEAAKKVFDATGGKGSQDKAVHFTNVVERVRRKSEADKHPGARRQSTCQRTREERSPVQDHQQMHRQQQVHRHHRDVSVDKHEFEVFLEQTTRAQTGRTRFSSDALGSTPVIPAKSQNSVGPEFLAASLLVKPDVDLREQRRRSSGFPGGQHGRVRFADAAFRDPNSQLQMQDLLTQQSRRKVTYGEDDLASSAAEIRKQYQREEGE